MLNKKNTRAGFTLIELMIVIAIIAILAAILVPNFMKARANGQLTACKSNLKNIATALEMYASDHNGIYPTAMTVLTTENYMKRIPTCPSASGQTYTGAYTVSSNPDGFTFFCSGTNHQKAYLQFNNVGANFPQYLGDTGMNEHP